MLGSSFTHAAAAPAINSAPSFTLRYSMAEPFPVTHRTRIIREANRAVYDRDAIYKILDEGLVCHVGFAAEGQPFVIPTMYARVDDSLYFHGSAASRMLLGASSGMPVCITVTMLDGLVLARSVFHHSMNYRSVVILGTARLVTDDAEKMRALRAIAEQIVRGRWDDARQPTEQEMRATTVLALPISEASAKIRTGPPKDEKEDYALPVWAGVLPLCTMAGAPEPDPALPAAIAGQVPAYVKNYRAPGSR
jgi:uncharacterized protein